jgi:leucyl-tRNA synthetase
MSQFGATIAFNRTVPFSEVEVLQEIAPYFKKTLNLVDVHVYLSEEAKTKGFSSAIVENAEPGSPAFEYYNV